MNHDDDKRHLWTCGCAAGLAQLLGVWIHTLCALTCLTHWGKNACEFWMVPCTSLVFYVWPLMFTVWLLVNTNRQPVSSRHPIYIGVCAYSSGCQHLSRHEVSHELTRTHTHSVYIPVTFRCSGQMAAPKRPPLLPRRILLTITELVQYQDKFCSCRRPLVPVGDELVAAIP